MVRILLKKQLFLLARIRYPYMYIHVEPRDYTRAFFTGA